MRRARAGNAICGGVLATATARARPGGPALLRDPRPVKSPVSGVARDAAARVSRSPHRPVAPDLPRASTFQGAAPVTAVLVLVGVDDVAQRPFVGASACADGDVRVGPWGGGRRLTAPQQSGQTQPRDGSSRGWPHAAHDGASAAATRASTPRRQFVPLGVPPEPLEPVERRGTHG